MKTQRQGKEGLSRYFVKLANACGIIALLIAVLYIVQLICWHLLLNELSLSLLAISGRS